MAGAWEFLEQKRVLCGILCTDTVATAWALGFRNLKGIDHVVAIQGKPFDHARNEACKLALEAGFDYLFFLDSDVVPPSDAVPRLLAHNLPVVSGVYYRRSPPLGFPVLMMRDPNNNGQLGWPTGLPANTMIEVDVVGAGCLLIHRSVLERLPPQRPGYHWFDWRVNLRGLGVCPDASCMSEDYTFNLHCKNHGIRTMVDTSVLCRHIGAAEAQIGQNGMPEFIPARSVG